MAGAKHLLYFWAIELNPLQIGTSRGTSRTLPINGYPLGPGGYGGWLPLPRHLNASVTKNTAVQSETA